MNNYFEEKNACVEDDSPKLMKQDGCAMDFEKKQINVHIFVEE
jgi:hypothetical protein